MSETQKNLSRMAISPGALGSLGFTINQKRLNPIPAAPLPQQGKGKDLALDPGWGGVLFYQDLMRFRCQPQTPPPLVLPVCSLRWGTAEIQRLQK
jgi:hypothetical protein